jgi:3-oxoacyl-[acyl-carrier protein] reductase
MTRLNGKIAIVTGASKGIGAAIALRLGQAGAAVVVNYASNRDGAEQVVAEIMTNASHAIAVQGDVSKADDVKRIVATTVEKVGRPSILVNNAGVFRFEPLEDVDEKEFHRQFNVNVLGTLMMTQEVVSWFEPAGGSVINISSVASTNPQPNSIVYCATKGAIDSMTVLLSRELGARKIRVNSIAPGGVATEGLAEIGIVGSEAERKLIAITPLGRFGRPEDVARVAEFLASDDAGWLTGERIAASGGWR